MDHSATHPTLSRYNPVEPEPPAPVDLRTRLSEASRRRLANRSAPSKVNRRELAKLRAQIEMEQLKKWAAEEFADLSWAARKKIALARFSTARLDGLSVLAGYREAGKCARVSERTAGDWMRDYITNEGFFTVSNWGRNQKTISCFDDPDVKLKSVAWWNAHKPKKGEPNARIIDFKRWLVGDPDAETLDGKYGPLSKILEERMKADVSEEQCRKFAHHLGFGFESLKKGTFNDEHNSDANVDDRNNRFIPEYFKYYHSSPHQVEVRGLLVDADELEDLSARVVKYTIADRGGVAREIDFGGVLPSRAGTVVHLLASHDESCAKAGEFQTRGWVKSDSYTCMDKSAGPSVHSAKYLVEYGNGTICLEPDMPPPQPVSLKQLKRYIQAKRAGESPMPLRSADVIMDPGKNQEGYWGSEETWMQAELAMDIFDYVFPTLTFWQFKLVAIVDWSQGHAAMPPDGLDATSMNNSAGGAQPHLRHTWYPRQNTLIAIERWIECSPGCQLCQAAFKEHGHDPSFQAVGRKGLIQVLKERNLYRLRMLQSEMVAVLQGCSDFSPKSLICRSHLYQMMQAGGHICLFGTKYHAELAAIERKWMWEKRCIRPKLNGKRERLHALLTDAHKKFTVLDARKAARHCRETMKAYIATRDMCDAGFEAVREQEVKYKSHRRVFDSCTGLLVAKAGAHRSAQQAKFDRRTEVARTLKKAKEEYFEQCELDWRSRCRRKARLSLSIDQLTHIKQQSKQRKIKHMFNKKA